MNLMNISVKIVLISVFGASENCAVPPSELGRFCSSQGFRGGAGKMVIKGFKKIKLLMIIIVRHADNCSSQ